METDSTTSRASVSRARAFRHYGNATGANHRDLPIPPVLSAISPPWADPSTEGEVILHQSQIPLLQNQSYAAPFLVTASSDHELETASVVTGGQRRVSAPLDSLRREEQSHLTDEGDNVSLDEHFNTYTEPAIETRSLVSNPWVRHQGHGMISGARGTPRAPPGIRHGIPHEGHKQVSKVRGLSIDHFPDNPHEGHTPTARMQGQGGTAAANDALHQGHSLISKVRGDPKHETVYDKGLDVPDSNLSSYWGLGSPNSGDHKTKDELSGKKGDENSSSGQHSPSPIRFDFKTAANWLRELLKQPSPHEPTLTQLPANASARSLRAEGHQLTILPKVDDRPREHAGPSARRSLTQRSTSIANTLSPFDNTLKSGVEKFQNLLNEALALANVLVDREERQRAQGWERLHHHHFASRDVSDESSCDLEGQSKACHPADSVRGSFDLEKISDERSSHSKPLETLLFPRRYGSDLDLPPGKRYGRGHNRMSKDSKARNKAHEYIRIYQRPPVQPRSSSLNLQDDVALKQRVFRLTNTSDNRPTRGSRSENIEAQNHAPATSNRAVANFRRMPKSQPAVTPDDSGPSQQDQAGQRPHHSRRIDLHRRSHVSLRSIKNFSLGRSHRRQPIARDWSPEKKRFVASVACISTALIGILIGIYAGLVPSIQYYIADMDHYAIMGNVFFYLGLAIPTFFFWPLPLLHGRKPYILSSLAIAMPLLFPQAIAVSTQRSPYVSTWRWCLLASRAFMGLALGFASMNFHSTLTDLFGASLMSGNPHQEIVDKYDVRRHGGGMGVWLGIWTWCFMGSISVGFLIGAAIINTQNPSWGFYLSIILIAVVLLLNVLCPEVRRSAYRRSLAEVRNADGVSRRVARGEVMMSRVQTGPKWWGEEAWHGVLLSLEMLRQPGFAVMALYSGWIYAQVVLIIVLLGSLTSQLYLLRSPLVGTCVAAVAIGAIIAIPFQKANLFSRARHHQENSNLQTLDKKVTWTSHLIRRGVFTIFLPLAGIAYTISSKGPPTPVEAPSLFAGAVGAFSCLAISECNGLMMETFDCSDLQPGMSGRRRSSSSKTPKLTNYSSFPRVTSGFAVSHSIGFVLAAGATGIGGMAQRNLGQRAATGIVAGILFLLSLLLLFVLVRFKEVQIIPATKSTEMDQWTEATKETIRRRSVAAAEPTTTQSAPKVEEEPWRPLIIGNPTHKARRVNLLELGSMTRWTEIRRKNRLIDQNVNQNRAAMEMAFDAVEETTGLGARGKGLVRRISQRSKGRDSASGSEAGSMTAGKPRREGDSSVPEAGSTRVTGHQHGGRAGYEERECVMDQTVAEEMAEELEGYDDDDGGSSSAIEMSERLVGPSASTGRPDSQRKVKGKK